MGKLPLNTIKITTAVKKRRFLVELYELHKDFWSQFSKTEAEQPLYKPSSMIKKRNICKNTKSVLGISVESEKTCNTRYFCILNKWILYLFLCSFIKFWVVHSCLINVLDFVCNFGENWSQGYFGNFSSVVSHDPKI